MNISWILVWLILCIGRATASQEVISQGSERVLEPDIVPAATIEGKSDSVPGEVLEEKTLDDFVPGEVLEEKTFNEYRVVIEWDKDQFSQRLKIFKRDMLVYIEDGYRFRIGLIYEGNPEDKLVQIGNDITGDGQPDMVVSDWSGGIHCCFTYNVFTVGDKFEHLATLHADHSDGATFQDVDKDGTLEFLTQDWTFAYWNASFASSPAPEVILKWNGKEYGLALALMRKPLPKKREYDRLIKAIKRERESVLKQIPSGDRKDYEDLGWYSDGVFIPPLVWDHLLWLIYTGHAQKAKDFLVKVWPADKAGKDVFWREFMEQLSYSSYCHAIRDYYGSEFPVLCK